MMTLINQSVWLNGYLRSLELDKWIGLCDRIEAHTIENPETHCMLCTYADNGVGYPYMKVGGRMVQVHQVVWVLENGSYPEDHYIQHLCGVRRCCRIEHLTVVSATSRVTEPSYRGMSNRNKIACPYGHLYSSINTYVSPKGKRQCKTCRRAKDRARYQRRKAIKNQVRQVINSIFLNEHQKP